MGGFTPGNKLSNGRPKGSPNKTTDKVRETIAKLTAQKQHDLDTAFEAVREENPAKYLELYLKLLEYTTPKLRAIDNKIDIENSAIEKIVVELKTRDNGTEN
jgi:hypothetical protein